MIYNKWWNFHIYSLKSLLVWSLVTLVVSTSVSLFGLQINRSLIDSHGAPTLHIQFLRVPHHHFPPFWVQVCTTDSTAQLRDVDRASRLTCLKNDVLPLLKNYFWVDWPTDSCCVTLPIYTTILTCLHSTFCCRCLCSSWVHRNPSCFVCPGWGASHCWRLHSI